MQHGGWCLLLHRSVFVSPPIPLSRAFGLSMRVVNSETVFFGFDVRWILLTGLFDLIGGGQPVRNTLLYTYIAEVVPSDYL
jgi:hypothetical protein